MLPLPPTKYPNVQRTITGTVDVFSDDVVLNCDTSTNPVTLNLGEIPFNATSGVGNWSTQYVLYINDISNNAGTNNITLVAGGTQTINNQATLVLNTNGASVMVMISGNGKYIVLNAPSGANSGFIIVTYAQLTALITGDDIIPNGDYLLIDAEFGTAPFMTPTNVFLKGMDLKNTANVLSQAIFFNADYQAVGNYTGITGFNSQLGVWTPLLAPVLNDVCIWDNRHYKNITGANGVTNPTTDNVNWSILPIQLNNGYISVVDAIVYDYSTNQIVFRKDVYENEVEKTVVGLQDSLNLFSWGNSSVRNNKVTSKSIFNICNNLTTTPNLSIINNVLNESTINIGSVNNPASITAFISNTIKGSTGNFLNIPITSFTENQIEYSMFDIGTAVGKFEKNKIFSSGVLIANNSGDFNFNILQEASVNLSTNSGVFNSNEIVLANVVGENLGSITNNYFRSVNFNANFVNSPSGAIQNNRFISLRVFEITLNEGDITYNVVELGSFTVKTINQGLISANILNDATFFTDTNIGGAGIEKNVVNSSTLSVSTNLGTLFYNEVSQQSTFVINTITLGIIVTSTTILGASSVNLITVSSNFGVFAKGQGNVVTNSSTINIDLFSALSAFMTNTIDGSEVLITTFTGQFFGNNISKCTINIIDLNNKTINNCIFHAINLGGLLPSLVMPTTIEKATAMEGNSTVSFELDCSDPSIYDLATTTLTIPPLLNEIGGFYTLTNAGGLTITHIVGLAPRWRTSFATSSGAVDFISTPVALAVGSDLVSPIGAGTYTITYHPTGGQDLIIVQESLGFTAIRETNILL
jgi:hypothetical protein